tara:strand:+ start:295 stop:762 length:468 start_codon:yes stop_codon:yes gene_type:complete
MKELEDNVKELIAGLDKEIGKLEKHIVKLGTARELLRGLNSTGPNAPSKSANVKRRRSGPYRKYVLDILKEKGSLTTFEITRELDKIGVRPLSSKPQTVIASAVRTMCRNKLVERKHSSRGLLYFIPATEVEKFQDHLERVEPMMTTTQEDNNHE